MKTLNVYRSKTALVYTLIFIKRNLITFRKFRQLYTEFWFPSPSRPPYNHICQIGDPVLRFKAEELKAEDIKKNEIQGVRKRISAFTVNFGCRDSTGETKFAHKLTIERFFVKNTSRKCCVICDLFP